MDVGQKIYFFFKENEMHKIQIPVQTARIDKTDTRIAIVDCYTYNYPQTPIKNLIRGES